eukprot:GHUV01010149.1.p1 GENE.GHUV01010149.1~~GHUV01010149.1.p1  ORF type:complete len:168 (+),score=46.43 GHUV01010149.1:208-711(+)
MHARVCSRASCLAAVAPKPVPFAFKACSHSARRCSLQPRPRPSRTPLKVAAVFSSTTTNPALTFGNVSTAISESRRGTGKLMTFDGTVNKAGLLLVMSTMSAAYTWMQIFSGNGAAIVSALNAAKVTGLIGMTAAVASMFKPQWSQYTAPGGWVVCDDDLLPACSGY